MSTLAFKQVQARLGPHLALDGITARFGSGLTGLIGPNGAGKSTLLRLAMGLLAPSAGDILLDDAPLAGLGLRIRAQKIAWLPQNGPVHWAMGVRDLVNLGRFASMATPQDDAAAVEETLKACGMAGFADRPVNTLSGGERSRVLLARVLAAQTPVLLADEPTSALDPAQQHRIMQILQARARSGTTVICALHDLPLAARYCQRLVFLRAGTIAGDGPPGEVLCSKILHQSYGLDFDERGYLSE